VNERNFTQIRSGGNYIWHQLGQSAGMINEQCQAFVISWNKCEKSAQIELLIRGTQNEIITFKRMHMPQVYRSKERAIYIHA